MAMTKTDLDRLAASMPMLEFDQAADSRWPKTDAVRTYLDFYHINFAREFTGVSHGFGRVDAAGFRIATQYWIPQNPRGTLVLVHGYYDHVGVFGHPIRWALQQNLAVLSFDLPGHGLSSGDQAAIDSFNQYGDVFAEILQQASPILAQPLYVLGQSTGGAVILNYLWRYAPAALGQFAKIALCSPLVVPRGWRGYHAGQYIYALLRHFIKHLARGESRSSQDPAFNHFVTYEDPLQSKYLSLRWVGAMKAWHEMFLRVVPLHTQALILQGDEDMTVDWRYNLPLLQRKLPNAQLTMIAGAGHQLVNERADLRCQVFAAVQDYFFNSGNQ